MEKVEAAAIPEIEEFDPPSDWAADEASDTLIVMLPGFRKEQLRVQLTSTGMLKISGERQIVNKRRRFSKEHPLPEHCDTGKISAKFEGGQLYVTLPKLVPPPKQPEVQATPQHPPLQPARPFPPPVAPMPQADQQKPSVPQQEPRAMPQPQPPPVPAAATPKADLQKPSVPQQEPPAMPQPTMPPPPAPAAPTPEADQQKPSQEVIPPKVTQKQPQKEKEKAREPKEKRQLKDQKAKKVDQEKKRKGLDEKEKVLQASPSLAYREAFVGLVEGVKKQRKAVNLVLAILFVLVLVLYVKDAIRSSSGGSKVQDL